MPQTPADFERLWKDSVEHKLVLQEIDEHERLHPKGKEALEDFTQSVQARKSKHMPKKSPYTVTVWMQINACIVRSYQRLWGDKSTLAATYMSNLVMSLVIGSVFYNTPENTSGFFSKVPIISNVPLSVGWCDVLRYLVQRIYGLGRDQSDVQSETNYCMQFLENLLINSKNTRLRLSIALLQTLWQHFSRIFP